MYIYIYIVPDYTYTIAWCCQNCG